MNPDKIISKVFNIPSLTEITLRHDLKYAYGDPDNLEEKANADNVFKQELIENGAFKVISQLIFQAVDTFGDGPVKTDFSWGFARK